jgi:uncharacterized glyoxalase superfamily protein PhnB
MDNRVSLVTLGVRDISRARGFSEALAWSGQSPDGEVVFFQAGGMVLALWGGDKSAEDSAVEDAGGWGGVTIGRPGAVTFWGSYPGIFIDPDGHPWEVAHNPRWILAEDGSVHLPD